MNDRRTSRALLFIRCSDGRILQANEAAEHIYQRSQKELESLTIRDLCARETKASVAKCIPRASRGAIVRRDVHRRKDGSTFSVEITWEPVTFGSTPTLVGVIDDLTERQSESGLRKAMDHRLLTELSHELRNALAPIHYSLEVLDHSEPGSTEAVRSRCAIGQQVNELSRAVDRIAGIGHLLAGTASTDTRRAG